MFTSINPVDQSSNMTPFMSISQNVAWLVWMGAVVWAIILLARKKKAWVATLGLCIGSALPMLIALSQIGKG
jgi:hypothetical protein